MTDYKMQLVDWLDDLCVRFIINLPHEELLSVERICFQIEEAQWFYEDFIRPLDPSLPSMNLRRFSMLMFQHCPLSSGYSEAHHEEAYANFLEYKTRVPVRGAIMLNQDMTQAVLVKGWKKGAKWSFPRGKINAAEADLDCAVREVYEETGYDLREAGLVGPDEQMKKIIVSMREQEMMLYVFRGVPMDTHFEPRTRKEISKIDWYKLTALPTMKRKNQIQQGTGQDLVNQNNFYMVAPFLGPLKSWIKQQQKLDKQRAKSGAHLAPPIATGITDTEEAEADLGETTADEAPIPDVQSSDANFANLVANLGRGHRSSDALPEVSSQQPTPQIDVASELKRLLSVGGGGASSTPPVEAPQPAQRHQPNPLLAMLQGNNRTPAPYPHTPIAPYPHTPIDQFMPSPALPQSPHGQHHPRPPQLNQLPPPPTFPLQSHQNLPFRLPQPPHMNQQHFNGAHMPISRDFFPPPPPQPNHGIPPYARHIQQAFNQQAPRPYQRTGDSHFAPPSQFPEVQGPSIPPASHLPAPNLTAHKMGLLNAFKSQDKPTPPPQQTPSQAPQSSQGTPRMQHSPAPHHLHESFASPPTIPSANPYAPTPPPFQSPPPSTNFQPVQPKPRNPHQDSLLNLFRSPSVSAVTLSPPTAFEPVELSAMPHTPGQARLPLASRNQGPSRPDLSIKPNLLEAFGQLPGRPDITSATVSGPVNVPDFETVKKHTHLVDSNGHSRGPSPAQQTNVGQKVFLPQQILRREESMPPKAAPVEIALSSKTSSPMTTSNVPTPQQVPFKPQILKRPQRNASPVSAPGSMPPPPAALGRQPSPQPPPSGPAHFPVVPTVQHAFDRRDNMPTGQKNALLSLFGNSSQIVSSPVQTSVPSMSPIPPHGLSYTSSGIPSLPSLPSKSPMPRSPHVAAASPQPPTPKSIMSGVISPVSPLPERGSAQNSPAHLASRSRISSIGDVMPPNIVIPKDQIPTSDPATAAEAVQNVATAIQRNGHGLGYPKLDDGYANTGSAGLGEELGAGVMLDRGKGRAIGVGKAESSPVDKTFLLGFLENVARGGRTT